MKLEHIFEAELLLELGDAPYPWKWVKDPTDGVGKSGEAEFTVDGNKFEVQLYHRSTDEDPNEDQTTIFWTKDGALKGDAEAGESQIRTMFTIADICKTYVAAIKPKYIKFEANKNPSSRGGRNRLASMYTRMVKRFATKMGYSITIDDGYETGFVLTRRDKKRRMGR